MSMTAILSNPASEPLTRAARPVSGEADAQVFLWARKFREMGLNPVPSRRDRKAPIIQHGWQEVPASTWAELEAKGRTANIQVMCGRRWGLVVVDLDGGEAVERWGELPRTWISRSGSRAGLHLWFSVPREGGEIRGGPFWRPEGEKHKEARLLGDRSFVVAPPSIHPESGHAYAWLTDRNPLAIPRPAQCPAWVFRAVERFGTGRRKLIREASRFDRSDNLDGIDPLWLAQQWGLRFAAKGPDRNGWHPCHSIDREDRTPSCSFHAGSGSYCDHATGRTLSLAGLGHALGALAEPGAPGWSEIKERWSRAASRAHARTCA